MVPDHVQQASVTAYVAPYAEIDYDSGGDPFAPWERFNDVGSGIARALSDSTGATPDEIKPFVRSPSEDVARVVWPHAAPAPVHRDPACSRWAYVLRSDCPYCGEFDYGLR